MVYAVEFSHRPGRDLINMAKLRTNVIPIVEVRSVEFGGRAWVMVMMVMTWGVDGGRIGVGSCEREPTNTNNSTHTQKHENRTRGTRSSTGCWWAWSTPSSRTWRSPTR